MTEYKYRNGVLKPKRKIFTHQRVIAGFCIVFAFLAFSNIRYFREHIPGVSHIPPIIVIPPKHNHVPPPIAGQWHGKIRGKDQGAPHHRTFAQVDLGRNRAVVGHSGSLGGSHSIVLVSQTTTGSVSRGSESNSNGSGGAPGVGGTVGGDNGSPSGTGPVRTLVAGAGKTVGDTTSNVGKTVTDTTSSKTPVKTVVKGVGDTVTDTTKDLTNTLDNPPGCQAP